MKLAWTILIEGGFSKKIQSLHVIALLTLLVDWLENRDIQLNTKINIFNLPLISWQHNFDMLVIKFRLHILRYFYNYKSETCARYHKTTNALYRILITIFLLFFCISWGNLLHPKCLHQKHNKRKKLITINENEINLIIHIR